MLEPIDFWKFHDTLNVYQATSLILNLDPSGSNHLGYNDSISYDTILMALQKDIRSEKLWADIVHDYDNHYSRNEPEIYWDKTTIGVSMLKEWLISKNCKPSFFFSSEDTSNPDYLNKDHPRYSEQLAAAVKVWIAFEDDNLLGAKSPKAAMNDWLTSRYSELGLAYKGTISKSAIEECAKVANWKDTGGATPTPSSKPTPPSDDIDNVDEIPF